jgi:polysaccharide biosynthesis protein PslG
VIIVFALGGSHGNGVSSKNSAPIVGIADNSLFGVSLKKQADQFSAMRSIGITSVRVDANWRDVQPAGPSDFHWTTLDQEVKSIRAAGMSIDLIIDGCPSWAALPSARNDVFAQPKSTAQYATWAAEVAGRYRNMGVRYFEIWNEPNINQFWRPKPNPVAYTADLVAAYSSIKKADPAAIVISGGLAPAGDNGINYSPVTFVTDMYSDGAKGSFDYLGDHPYSYPLLPNTYSPGSAWSQMDETKPSIRSIMVKNGDSSKKVWITEFGAPSTGRPGVDPAAQRDTLTQAIAYANKTDWIAALYIYTWRDYSTKPTASTSFGLESINGTPKPAFYAVSKILHHSG